MGCPDLREAGQLGAVRQRLEGHSLVEVVDGEGSDRDLSSDVKRFCEGRSHLNARRSSR